MKHIPCWKSAEDDLSLVDGCVYPAVQPDENHSSIVHAEPSKFEFPGCSSVHSARSAVVGFSDLGSKGAAVAERLACSPSSKANRVQFPAGSLPDFRMWESCRTLPLDGRYAVSSALSFRRCSVLTSITLIGSQGLAVKSRPNLHERWRFRQIFMAFLQTSKGYCYCYALPASRHLRERKCVKVTHVTEEREAKTKTSLHRLAAARGFGLTKWRWPGRVVRSRDTCPRRSNNNLFPEPAGNAGGYYMLPPSPGPSRSYFCWPAAGTSPSVVPLAPRIPPLTYCCIRLVRRLRALHRLYGMILSWWYKRCEWPLQLVFPNPSEENSHLGIPIQLSKILSEGHLDGRLRCCCRFGAGANGSKNTEVGCRRYKSFVEEGRCNLISKQLTIYVPKPAPQCDLPPSARHRRVCQGTSCTDSVTVVVPKAVENVLAKTSLNGAVHKQLTCQHLSSVELPCTAPFRLESLFNCCLDLLMAPHYNIHCCIGRDSPPLRFGAFSSPVGALALRCCVVLCQHNDCIVSLCVVRGELERGDNTLVEPRFYPHLFAAKLRLFPGHLIIVSLRVFIILRALNVRHLPPSVTDSPARPR
ncbi:hypothetical protein PR048_002957 [Dryococelus australis]|uniref:Uncharacterized protein n=1 Tax=Dryococelus australis TaxID=614101 RepID=A0ABQ9INY0_9NEOP|nr:hypothetical protein PR048_002957 [Dryococelus australis]